MYLRECLVENVGPVKSIDLTLPFNDDGSPKPIILVGRNGSGKSILLSHVIDALIEFAKSSYQDVLIGQGGFNNPYFKMVGGINQRAGSEYGLALLEFSNGESSHCYVDKTGTLDPTSFKESGRSKGRFSTVLEWPTEGNHKSAPIADKYARQYFADCSVCFFPSDRHERPHWLNPEGVQNRAIFYHPENYSDRLYKPIIVESAAKENKEWLLDIFLDSLVEVEPYIYVDQTNQSQQVDLRSKRSVTDAMFLLQGRRNVEIVLSAVLQDDQARFHLNYRSISPYRLSIQMSDGTLIPSLDHLSSGQANLFNMFCSIIRYSDRSDLRKSTHLNEIEGIVIIDEIESQAHSDLQYEVLPKLLKFFPKVQFILTSHSPLFLLGMENVYGTDGYHTVEMPEGNTITSERFSEFKRSWEYYRSTTAYEQSIERALQASHKPLVLTEGETDAKYIRTALTLMERTDILQSVDIEQVGSAGPRGAVGAGDTGLNNTANMLEANPQLATRRVLLVYDCDTRKPDSDTPRVSIRTIPKNELNTVAIKGVENLFPEELFEQRFYVSREKVGAYGERTRISTFDKTAFCDWICDERREADDFSGFGAVIAMLEEFLAIDDQETSALPEQAPHHT